MKIKNERDEVRTVAERWKRKYGADGGVRGVEGRLLALNVESATAADVAEIIGMPGWVAPWECGECGVKSWDCIQLGEEPDYESATTEVCLPCLRKAVFLAASTKKTP